MDARVALLCNKIKGLNDIRSVRMMTGGDRDSFPLGNQQEVIVTLNERHVETLQAAC